MFMSCSCVYSHNKLIIRWPHTSPQSPRAKYRSQNKMCCPGGWNPAWIHFGLFGVKFFFACGGHPHHVMWCFNHINTCVIKKHKFTLKIPDHEKNFLNPQLFFTMKIPNFKNGPIQIPNFPKWPDTKSPTFKMTRSRAQYRYHLAKSKYTKHWTCLLVMGSCPRC